MRRSINRRDGRQIYKWAKAKGGTAHSMRRIHGSKRDWHDKERLQIHRACPPRSIRARRSSMYSTTVQSPSRNNHTGPSISNRLIEAYFPILDMVNCRVYGHLHTRNGIKIIMEERVYKSGCARPMREGLPSLGTQYDWCL